MIVFVGGMPRSGSTFTFNIARETLGRLGKVAAIPVDRLDAALENLDNEQHLIVKAHGTDVALGRLIQVGGATCICSFRKPEESVASWMRTFGFGFEEALGVVQAWLLWHKKFSHLAMNIDYRDIELRPLRTILQIQRHLLGRVHYAEAVRLWRVYDRDQVAARVSDLEKNSETVDIGFSYYDKSTFFHRRHVSPPGQRTANDSLSSQQIAHVRKQLAGYIDYKGDYTFNP